VQVDMTICTAIISSQLKNSISKRTNNQLFHLHSANRAEGTLNPPHAQRPARCESFLKNCNEVPSNNFNNNNLFLFHLFQPGKK
jgi:hypothetical protein